MNCTCFKHHVYRYVEEKLDKHACADKLRYDEAGKAHTYTDSKGKTFSPWVKPPCAPECVRKNNRDVLENLSNTGKAMLGYTGYDPALVRIDASPAARTDRTSKASVDEVKFVPSAGGAASGSAPSFKAPPAPALPPITESDEDEDDCVLVEVTRASKRSGSAAAGARKKKARVQVDIDLTQSSDEEA